MLPFMHVYGSAGGDLVPCCEAQEIPLNEKGESAIQSWNNKNYKELRRALANGERPKRCDVCWHNEDSGIISNRLQWEKDNWKTFSDIIDVNDDYTVNNKPYWVELKVSNFCNLKCIMCSTHSSYKRVADLDIIKKYTTDGYETRLLRPTTLFESLGKWPSIWDTVHTLQFTGGEPIINKEHYDLLDSIENLFPKNEVVTIKDESPTIKIKVNGKVINFTGYFFSSIKHSGLPFPPAQYLWTLVQDCFLPKYFQLPVHVGHGPALEACKCRCAIPPPHFVRTRKPASAII